MTVFEKIEAQQKGFEDTAIWMVGEQLKDICSREPDSAILVAQDLENKDMSLANAEKKIKAYADKHRKGNFACVPPNVAEKILREFYGLPGAAAPKLQVLTQTMPEKPKPVDDLDLSAFF